MIRFQIWGYFITLNIFDYFSNCDSTAITVLPLILASLLFTVVYQ